MRTAIRGSWVVGFDGNSHRVYRDGVVVFEHDRVVFVGKSYPGDADRIINAAGRLVCPGLITTHLHAGLNVADYPFLDPARTDAFARNYLFWYAPRRGSRRIPTSDATTAALFGLAHTIRSGATTIVELGGAGNPGVLARVATDLGARVYTGPQYASADFVTSDDGRLEAVWDEAKGISGLQAALAFADDLDLSSSNGRVRPLLCPRLPDTCTPELLQETVREGRARKIPITLHAGLNLIEFGNVMAKWRKTPVEYLDSIGFLGPDVILSHCLFIAGHSWTNYPYGDDLAILARSGTSVSHSPLKYAIEGVLMESFSSYLAAGVRMTIGTDFFPNDILAEMRLAGQLSKVAERKFTAGTDREIFDAATIGGAAALGRDDLGRLAPGAKADIIVVNLSGLRFGAVHDPIKSLIESATGADLEAVFIDGRQIVDSGQFVAVEEESLLAKVQAASDAAWEATPTWDYSSRAIDEVVPPAYPME